MEKIPTVKAVRHDLHNLVKSASRVSDRMRQRVHRHCQLDDAQILGMVQSAQAILIEAHERMAL